MLRQGMLLKNKEAVHAALADLADAPGIRSIRIYDKQGEIHFATVPRDVRNKITRSAEVCVTCHGMPFGVAEATSSTRTFRDASGMPVMAQSRMIRNSEQCAGGRCHVSTASQEYLGLMDFQMSMEPAEEGRVSAERATLWTAVLMAVVGGVATALFIWRFVRRPVLSLVEGTRRVAAGDLSARVKVTRGKELIELADAFNQMGSELAIARERSEKWEDDLAQAVEKKTNELAVAQRHITHMEKMASLGKLAATVAHELNNPLGGILVYAKLIQRDLAAPTLTEEERKDLQGYVEMVRSESSRCGEIVKNLLSFARVSKDVTAENRVNAIVEKSLMTVQHLFKTNNVEHVVTLTDGDDRLVCDAAQIQQALVALLVNAAEAMPDGGVLRILTEAEPSSVVVTISDTGVGIPPDVLPDIFEPFVSTKGDKGVGLGLAVVYGIVRRHDGRIDVESRPGAGTTFRMVFPRAPAAPPPSSRAAADSKVVDGGE
ncbi:MAG: HAMP domain-containing protein [Myxococcales bacterium]|nr:HAMP domain-containing protein [Myxococcales bacterium]